MKRTFSIIILLSLNFFPSLSFSETNKEGLPELEPVVVTATKMEVPISQVSSSIKVITRDDLEDQKISSLAEALRNIPGVRLKQLGGPGSFTSVQIRGSRSSQVHFQIDGAPVTDATDVNNSFTPFIENMLVDDIERIEILKGNQSTLYGSDAIGGVINIITRKGGGTLRPKIDLFFEGGSEDQIRETLTLRGALTDRIGYRLTGSRQDSDGIDSHDEYGLWSTSGRLDIKICDNLSLQTNVRYIDSIADLDDFPMGFNRNFDDPSNVRESDLFNWSISLNHTPYEWWDYKLTYSQLDTLRGFLDNPTLDSTGDAISDFFDGFRGFFESRTRNLDWQHNFYLGEMDTFTLGFEYEEQEARTFSESSPPGLFTSGIRDKVNNLGYYFQNQLSLEDRLFITAGLRIDNHEVFGTEYNTRVSLAYLLRETGSKFKFNYGSGFKAPSSFQLFDPFFGNPGLNPEESDSFDVGVEQDLFQGKITLAATWFKNDFRNLIGFDPFTFRSVNIGAAKAQGVELEATLKPLKGMSLSLNYTFINSENLILGDEEIQGIPNDTAGLNFNYRFRESFNVNFDVSFKGDDQFDLRGNVINKEYAKADLVMSYDLTSHLQLFARFDNLFNADIVENGFQGAPAWYYFGVKTSY